MEEGRGRYPTFGFNPTPAWANQGEGKTQEIDLAPPVDAHQRLLTGE